MHSKTLTTWQHAHDFSVTHEQGQRRTTYALIMTAATMVLEIIAGIAFGSIALLADGWHMATHVAAFLITLFAYHYANRHANDPQFTFGTGKVSVLGGFASAIALLVVALIMAIESLMRLFQPEAIQFGEAMTVAALGLLINLVCAVLLHEHGHGHHHDHHHTNDNTDHHHEHNEATTHTHNDHAHAQDHNLKAAYFHVLADALTSVLAIAALAAGMLFGWIWIDAVMGFVGAGLISYWSLGLIRQTAPILLDENTQRRKQDEVRSCIEGDSDNRVADLHLWKVGPADDALIVSIVTHFPRPVEHYKTLLHGIKGLAHITVEVNRCSAKPCLPTGTKAA